MASERENLLKELLIPLGFRKVSKTRAFVRLSGDGVFLCAEWAQSSIGPVLSFSMDSIWKETSPGNHLPPVMSVFNSFSTEQLSVADDGKTVIRDFMDYPWRKPPIEIVEKFQTKLLPLLLQCETQEQLFAMRINFYTAHTTPKKNPHYYWSKHDVNLALRLNKYDYAVTNLDGLIQQNLFFLERDRKELYELEEKLPQLKKEFDIEICKRRIEICRDAIPRYEEETQGCFETKERIIAGDVDYIEARLQAAKKKNLENYSILMKGKVDDEIAKYL